MKICIYQIELSLDEKRVAFQSYDDILRLCDGSLPLQLYRKVYEGTVEAEDLEEVFYFFNMDYPADFVARSLSMSDVIEIVEDGGSRFYICDTFGFKEVAFDASKVQEVGK